MRRLKLLGALFSVLAILFVLIGCSKNTDNKQNDAEYTVEWKNSDGTILETDIVKEGTVPTYDGETPSISIPGEENTFNGWDKEVVKCEGNTVYTATYNIVKCEYTVSFYDDNNTLIYSNVYHYGDSVIEPDTPVKQSSSGKKFTFAGWDKPLVSIVTESVNYVATFTSEDILYTIKFVDYDGTEISSYIYKYGNNVSVPDNPTRESTNLYNYTFAGWTPSVTECVENKTYTATYTQTDRLYSIIWKNYNGTELYRTSCKYGEIPVYKGANPERPATETAVYEYSGWDKTIAPCTGDAEYIALYNEVQIEKYVISIVGINPSETMEDNAYNTATIGTVYYKKVGTEYAYYSDSQYSNKIDKFNYSYDHFTIGGLYTSQITNNGFSSLSVNENNNICGVDGKFNLNIQKTLFSSNTTIYAKCVPNKYTATFEAKECDYGVTTNINVSSIEFYYNEVLSESISYPTNNYYYARYYISGDTNEYYDSNGNPTNNRMKYENVEFKIDWSNQIETDYTYIKSVDDFNNISNDYSGKYLLITDLDFDGDYFAPFETFEGKLRGDYHTISNFKIEMNGSGNANVGLFKENYGWIENLYIGAENKNVTISADFMENNSISSLHIGAIAGYNEGVITGCIVSYTTITGTIRDNNNNCHVYLWQGGVVGYSHGGNLSNCKVINSEIIGIVNKKVDSGDDSYGTLGGLCGKSTNDITDCEISNTTLDLFVDADGEWNNDSFVYASIGGILGEQQGGKLISNAVNNVYMKVTGGRGGYTKPTFYAGKILGYSNGGSGIEDNTIVETPPIDIYQTNAGVISLLTNKSDDVGVKYSPGKV